MSFCSTVTWRLPGARWVASGAAGIPEMSRVISRPFRCLQHAFELGMNVASLVTFARLAGFVAETATIPALRVEPELRRAAEAVLNENESLSSFMEASLRASIAQRGLQREFIARGLAAHHDRVPCNAFAIHSSGVRHVAIRTAFNPVVDGVVCGSDVWRTMALSLSFRGYPH
jgi:hypothetical protein